MKMQQTKSYWYVVAVAGVVGAFVASACVVTTSTDAGGAGGTETFAGSTGTTGGTNSLGGPGGTAGISGSTAVAGSTSVAGTSGAGPTPFQCDPADGKPVGPPASCAATVGNTCSECTAAHCCTEYSDCYATNPGNQCGYGGPTGDNSGEIMCIQACVIAATSDGGVADDTTIATCTNNCVTPKDSANVTCSAVIGQQTNDLVACLNTSCQAECFGG
jgi:hypothetical protein